MNNKRIYISLFLKFLISFIFFLNISLYSQAIGDYRSAATGNWSILTTWERYNGTAWVTPTGGEGVPSSASGVITILSGQTVSIPNVNQTADQMTINSGGQVTIGIGRTLTIANGTATDLTVNGTLANSGTLTLNTGVMVTFGSGSAYQHNKDGGVIPTATWDVNSTCLITGIIGTIPTGLGQTFGHLTWNCPGQTVASTPSTTYNILGNLTVQNTGTGQFRIGTGTTSNNNVLGNYLQSGGTVRISGATARTLNVSGNFNLSGGTFLMSSAATLGTLNIAGNFSHSSGIIDETSTGSGLIVFNGTSNQSYTGGGTITNTINFTINNSAGITLLTSVAFPAGLTMTNGNINLNGNILTLGTGTTNTGTLSWTNGFMVGSGSFTRWYSTASITIGNVLGLFPTGNGTDNRSVWIGGTPSTGGTVSVQYTNANGTTALSFVENSQTFDKRTNMSWTLSGANGFAGSALSLRIQGSGIPGINAVADLNISLASTAAGGTYVAPSGTITNPQVNRTDLTQATLANTFYFAATSASPLPVELSSFSAIVLENLVRLNWRTETEVSNYGFEVERLQEYKNEKLQDWEKIGFVEGFGNSNSPKNYSFLDQNVSSGKYSYRLKQIDTDGKFEYSKVIEVDLGSPTKFELSQNYPNPFNPITTIKFSIPQPGNVKLTVYNLLGEQVAELVNGFREAGVHKINFNAENFNSGFYIYKIEASGFVQSRKMILIR